ncbi:MAG: hypothetical protein GF308_04215 [Candidatus Heimdallarchaeota archaeon]|nr:hypothetical protein [Candidatus Heimdallarchaeota archaeon]
MNKKLFYLIAIMLLFLVLPLVYSLSMNLQEPSPHFSSIPLKTSQLIKDSPSSKTSAILTNNEKNQGSALSPQESLTFWVEANKAGDGTSEATPAGNISYVLSTYDLTNAVIKVKPGVYNSSLETFPLILEHDNLVLESTDDYSSTIITGLGADTGPENCNGINVLGNNITIQGFTIQANEAGILLEHTNENTLTDNLLTNNVWFSIKLDNSSSNTIANNIITDSLFDGICIENSYSSDVYGSSFNTIINNEITAVGDDGIWVCGVANNTITNNTISQCQDGVRLWDSANYNDLLTNTIFQTKEAVDLANSNHTFIANNKITDNYVVGLKLTSSQGNFFESNNFAENGEAISLSNSKSNIICSNVFTKNREYDLLLKEVSNENHIFENNFLDEEAATKDESGDNYFNSSLIGNYWQVYTGTDEEPPIGIGDEPYNISGSGGSWDYLPPTEPFDIIDLLSPRVTIVQPENGSAISSTNVTVAWTGNDPWGSIDHYSVCLDGERENVGTVTTKNFLHLEAGQHHLLLRAVDQAGNVGETSLMFTVEFAKPVVELLHPTSETYFEAELDINVSVTSSIAISNVYAEIDDELNVSLESYVGNIYHDTYTFTAGSHTLRIYAIDTAGNVNDDETVTFTVNLESSTSPGTTELPTIPIPIAFRAVLFGIIVIGLAYYIRKKGQR